MKLYICVCLCILLAACSHEVRIGQTTEVDKAQDYRMPRNFQVRFETVEDISAVCPTPFLSCIRPTGPYIDDKGLVVMQYYSYIQYNKKAALHECAHPIYGPKHKDGQ